MFDIFSNFLVGIMVSIDWKLFSFNYRICIFFGEFYNINSIFIVNYSFCLVILSSKIWNCINCPFWFNRSRNLLLYQKLELKYNNKDYIIKKINNYSIIIFLYFFIFILIILIIFLVNNKLF